MQPGAFLDGKTLAVFRHPDGLSSKTGSLLLWDAAAGAGDVQDLKADLWLVFWAVAAPDGKVIAAAGPGGSVRLWNVSTGEVIRMFDAGSDFVLAAAISADGRTFATSDLDGSVSLWETASGQRRRLLKGEQGFIDALAFSPDGRRLYTGGHDGTVLAWDLTGRDGTPGADLDDKVLGRLWDDLGGDAARAYQAVWTLAGSPRRSVPFLKARLRQPPLTPERIAGWIADLDADDFDTREPALAELRSVDEAAEPALRVARMGQPSPEARRRLDELLEWVRKVGTSLHPADVRVVRAIEGWRTPRRRSCGRRWPRSPRGGKPASRGRRKSRWSGCGAVCPRRRPLARRRETHTLPLSPGATQPGSPKTPGFHDPARQRLRALTQPGSPRNPMMRWLPFPLALALLASLPAAARSDDDLGLRVPPGFRVTLYADQDLANDIYAMTLDADGHVVVTSQGWIKRLLDTKGAGKADKAEVIAPTTTGGMGMCFDGGDLYFCGDGWFSRYRAGKEKGTLEPKPENFVPLAFTEHGGHAMRKGPDGWWYVIGGNDSGIDQRHVTRPDSPVKKPEAGAILRLPPDCKSCEVIAHGFRNPYDFDFNADGEIFTYDSDVEADYFLPWYSPTRLYHVAYGGHHGWRLDGYKRSWARPDYYLDTVDILYPIGRGSPTGVACYRHDQFPEHYRGGIFACDWTFGKVYYLPADAGRGDLQDEAGSLFGGGRRQRLRSDGHRRGAGRFAVHQHRRPQDARGRLPRRVRRRRQDAGATAPEPKTDLDKVLQAPQPLDAWSRARWEPLARKLGAQPFLDAVADEKRDEADRVRAVEVLTELFDGLPAADGGRPRTTGRPRGFGPSRLVAGPEVPPGGSAGPGRSGRATKSRGSVSRPWKR